MLEAAEKVVLISSDCQRVFVTRSIVTEASYVLRDLLDGREACASEDPSNFIMNPSANTKESENEKEDRDSPPPSYSHVNTTESSRKKYLEVSLPFITGSTLKLVWEHMKYRFCTAIAVDDNGRNTIKVYPVPMKAIPKPMVLSLNDYLDTNDRNFVADWDELRTIQMVKAATLLRYEELLQLASAKLATYLLEKNVEGIRTLLGVECDFSPEEVAQLKKEEVEDTFY